MSLQKVEAQRIISGCMWQLKGWSVVKTLSLRLRGQKCSSQLCHTLQAWFSAKIRASKSPRCFKVRACFQSQCWLPAADPGEGMSWAMWVLTTVAQEGVGSAPASHAPIAAALRSLLRSECHCSPHTPQQLCSCWRVNKPAPAVPMLFTPAPWACSGWRDGTGGLCCVSSSLERRSKPFLTNLPILPGLNGVLFFSCQRERHETWLCDPNPWTSPGAGESWKFDLVQEPLNK